jgi:hypothetical protein
MGVIEKQRDLRCERRLRGLIHFGPLNKMGGSGSSANALVIK